MLTCMRRLRPARVRDLRLWLGLTLIVVAMLIGARVLSGGRDTVVVWQASRDMAAGAAPVDLVPREVERSVAGSTYVSADETAQGELRWPVAAGQLLPRAALVERDAADTRAVPVPVDPRHLPVSLHAGDRVDVWTTSTQEGTDPRQVASALLVADVTQDPSGIASDLTVMLTVPVEQVQGVVAASRTGSVDLVTVPIGAPA